ncbi:MAG: Smr/MutS family protein [Phycisphaerales bacterium]|nr:Smr/MutS family protein [Phycisphaerales bacterium]
MLTIITTPNFKNDTLTNVHFEVVNNYDFALSCQYEIKWHRTNHKIPIPTTTQINANEKHQLASLDITELNDNPSFIFIIHRIRNKIPTELTIEHRIGIKKIQRWILPGHDRTPRSEDYQLIKNDDRHEILVPRNLPSKISTRNKPTHQTQHQQLFIDLHWNRLIEHDYIEQGNIQKIYGNILNYQIIRCREYLRDACHQRIYRCRIITGIGDGTLRNKVLELIREEFSHEMCYEINAQNPGEIIIYRNNHFN